MTDRTFHKRFTLPARIGLMAFVLLAGYFFWVKVAAVGILLAIVAVGMMERILHTTYTFRKVKPIDREEEMEYLIIGEGRFSAVKTVPICDVYKVERVSAFFGLDYALVIHYGHRNMVAVQPDNPEAFRKEIGRRVESEERKVKNPSEEQGTDL